jgi:hypothetical protein
LLVLLDVLGLIVTYQRSEAPAVLILRFLPAGGGLLVCVAVAALLRALAAVVDRLPPKGQALSDLVGRLDASLGQIRVSVDQIPSELHERLKSDVLPHADRPDAAAQMTDADAVSVEQIARSLHKAVSLLEEIREASLLDEPGKAALRVQHRRRHRAEMLADADRRVALREWGKAEKILAAVETEFPGDADAAKIRSRLEQGRHSVSAEAFEPLQTKVEDLMAIASWDEAYATASAFAEKFPGNSDAASLVARVARERELFKESTVQRLYDDMKQDIERRNWRAALTSAQRLLERFPDNRRAEKVRAQFRTIQDNAEIEERQEQEAKIQELVRAKRFAEAIELAEDVLDRFPNSPQADSLAQLLPKMRELAIQHEVEA